MNVQPVALDTGVFTTDRPVAKSLQAFILERLPEPGHAFQVANLLSVDLGYWQKGVPADDKVIQFRIWREPHEDQSC